MKDIQTVNDKEFKEKVLEFESKFDFAEKDDKVFFSIEPAQEVKTIGDRKVFFINGYKKGNVLDDDTVNTFLLNAEDCIELGNALINAATQALINNMCNSNLNQMINILRQYVEKDYVAKLVVKCVNENPVNFNEDYFVFNFKPIIAKGKENKFIIDDFNFDMILFNDCNSDMDEFKKFIRDVILMTKKDIKITVLNFNKEKVNSIQKEKIIKSLDECTAIPVSSILKKEGIQV